MRMSRWDWLARFFQPRRRTKAKREKREPKPMRRWDCYPQGMRHISRIEALTKSEARAQAKKALGIGKKGRLPPGSVVRARLK